MDRAADEVDAVCATAELGDRVCDPERGADSTAARRRRSTTTSAGRAGMPSSARRRSARLTTPTSALVAQHGDTTVLGRRHESTQLGQRSFLVGAHDVAAHDPAHRGVREVVANRLVEILAAHAAHEPAAPPPRTRRSARVAGRASSRHEPPSTQARRSRAGIDMTSRASASGAASRTNCIDHATLVPQQGSRGRSPRLPVRDLRPPTRRRPHLHRSDPSCFSRRRTPDRPSPRGGRAPARR